jgi:hypothetical protein
MIYKGYGSVWNPKKKNILVDFSKEKEFITRDPYEMSLLDKSNQILSKKQESQEIETEKLQEDLENSNDVIIPQVDEETIEQKIKESSLVEYASDSGENAVILPEPKEMTKEEVCAELDILGISYKKNFGIKRLTELLLNSK